MRAAKCICVQHVHTHGGNRPPIFDVQSRTGNSKRAVEQLTSECLLKIFLVARVAGGAKDIVRSEKRCGRQNTHKHTHKHTHTHTTVMTAGIQSDSILVSSSRPVQARHCKGSLLWQRYLREVKPTRCLFDLTCFVNSPSFRFRWPGGPRSDSSTSCNGKCHALIEDTGGARARPVTDDTVTLAYVGDQHNHSVANSDLLDAQPMEPPNKPIF